MFIPTLRSLDLPTAKKRRIPKGFVQNPLGQCGRRAHGFDLKAGVAAAHGFDLKAGVAAAHDLDL